MFISKNSISLFILFVGISGYGQALRKRTTMLMGSRFDITIVAKDSATAEMHIDEAVAEISRIENLISDWKPDSQVSEVSRQSGIKPVKVDREVFELTQRAVAFSEMTGGAFDISFAAMEKIWKFDGSMSQMPKPEEVKKSIAKVGYKNIVSDSVDSTIFLKLEGMKIGFGSIGKGYAADKARQLMKAKGVQAGIINASGDIAAWGRQPDGTDWSVGITNPFDTNAFVGILPLNNGAVTTSGTYEKFIEIDGRRYSHIINPATGYPSAGVVSVTVFGESAEMANAFSTSIIVLGKKAGLQLINQYPGYSCVIITDKGKIIRSANFSSKVALKLTK